MTWLMGHTTQGREYHHEQSVQRATVRRQSEPLMINRLLWRVHELDPTQLKPINWHRKKTRHTMGSWLCTQTGLLAELARDELADIDHLSDAIDELSARIADRVRAVAPTLLALPGCAELTAAKIVSETACVERFKSEAAFARHIGLAPVPALVRTGQRAAQANPAG